MQKSLQKQKKEQSPTYFAVRKSYKPSADHPWRRFKPVVSEANLINEVIHKKKKVAKKKKRDY